MSLILAINSGSSSLKISLYQRVTDDPKAPRLLLTSAISSISSPPVKVSFQCHANESLGIVGKHLEFSEPLISDHGTAFTCFLERLEQELRIDLQQVKCICHRVVHGGDCTEPTVVSKESYHHIETLADLAPLHNASALSVISKCLASLPHARSIAFFDTAFHKDLPRHVSTYAIDQKIAQERGLRKYGFHGLSYAFIRRTVAAHLHKDETALNIIALHLGSGASVCAIRCGKSIDTSMGLTPLSGLPGATRAGDVDPSLIFHYTSDPQSRLSYGPATAKEMHVTGAEQILNSQAGWKAIAGTTDFREITEKADLATPPSVGTDDSCTLAFHVVLDRVLHYVGAYHLSLRGEVDALVFAGGIGERSQELRSAVGDAVNCLGYSVIDEQVNRKLKQYDDTVVDIGKQDGGKRILVCRTDEQFEMARGCSLRDEFWN